ncbi:MAG: FRG domain-containing protein [Candidatus Binatus sp.]
MSKTESVDKYRKGNTEHGSKIFEVWHVAEFVHLACWLYTTYEVIFRGQRENWSLLPSVARDADHVGADEDKMLEEFKREALPFLDRMQFSSLQWLALAQHGGLPTRMIDWTRNPLVALWFAVRDQPKDQAPAVVWAYSYQFSDVISDSKDPFDIAKVYVYFPEHVYRTIQAQDGVFTVHPRMNRFEQFETIRDADMMLTKIEIPSEVFRHIRWSLYRLGTHEGSLFPGLSGIAGKIKYKYRLLEDELPPSKEEPNE